MKSNAPWGYTMLWLLVLCLTVIIGISFFIYGVGTGRWVCDEWSEPTCYITCGDTKSQQSPTLWGSCEDVNKIKCNISKVVKEEGTCMKAVWARVASDSNSIGKLVD